MICQYCHFPTPLAQTFCDQLCVELYVERYFKTVSPNFYTVEEAPDGAMFATRALRAVDIMNYAASRDEIR
jgi:phage terminase large subunit GpA-like protein